MTSKKIFMKTITYAIFILQCLCLQAQQISSEEQSVVDYLKSHEQEQIDFLEQSVNINSGTLNLAGVKAVGMMYQKELDAIGFSTRWIPMPDSLNREGHLFAEIKGSTGKTILLIGHLDTVFEKDHEFQTFNRSGNIAKGPGANDMKGGNAMIIYALKALHAAGALEGKNIIVAFTGDEEKPGKPLSISRKDLVDAGKKADIALRFKNLNAS